MSSPPPVGSQADILNRLNTLLPHGWFAVGASPVKDAILTGVANALSFVYSLFAYLKLQTRISTATDGFLDMIAADFFGSFLTRSTGQSDSSFRSIILASIVRKRNTRASVIAILKQLTGYTPTIYEPLRPGDTGGYDGPTIGYGVAGCYGSMLLPFQSFVTAYRPAAPALAYVAGYGVSTGAYSTPSRSEYIDISMFQGLITDADIYAAINSVRPAGYIIWSRISSNPPAGA